MLANCGANTRMHTDQYDMKRLRVDYNNAYRNMHYTVPDPEAGPALAGAGRHQCKT